MKKAEAAALVKKIDAFCLREGLRFTPPRQHVLEIIAMAVKPIVAYDVLAQLGFMMDNPKPPTAYRAIEFLMEHQFIHRIESLNAYVVCQIDHRHAGSQFMICDDCGQVSEAHLCHLPDALADKTESQGFHTTRWNLELHGFCRHCVG